MTFLYPEFLYGLLALAIPIIIHLFNFRKTRKVYFSNNRFLKKIQEANQPKRKIKELLVLLSRLAFLFFLVMAFAQPLFNKGADENSQKSVYIYLDNSLSMSSQHSTGERSMDIATTYVSDIVASYPINTKFKLLTNEFSANSTRWKSPKEVEDLLTEVRLVGTSRSFAEVQSRMENDPYQLGDTQKNFYMISDFQKSTLGDISDIGLDSTSKYNLVPIYDDEINNILVDSLYLENPFLLSNQDNELVVKLRNTGKSEVRDVPIKLFINEVQVSNSTGTIPPNGTKTLTFALNQQLEDNNKCRLSFEDFPITFDNDFYFSLRLASKIRILEIKDTKGKTPIERVFGNEELFDFRSNSIRNLDYNLLNSMDLIVLNGLPKLNSGLNSQLIKHLGKGASVILVPGSSLDIASYRDFLGFTPEFKQLTDNTPAKLSAPVANHPFYKEVFDKSTRKFDMPSAQLLLNANQGSPIIKFRNGENYLSEVTRTGHLYLFASGFAEQFGGFHRNAVFVPTMYKIASYSKVNDEALYQIIGAGSFALRLEERGREEIYKFSNDRSTFIPAQTRLGNSVKFDVPQEEIEAGHYSLILDDATVGQLSFNAGKQESYLDRYDIEDIQAFLGDGDHIKVFDESEVNTFKATISQEQEGQTFWRIALFLALLFLLIEVLLIRFL